MMTASTLNLPNAYELLINQCIGKVPILLLKNEAIAAATQTVIEQAILRQSQKTAPHPNAVSSYGTALKDLEATFTRVLSEIREAAPPTYAAQYSYALKECIQQQLEALTTAAAIPMDPPKTQTAALSVANNGRIFVTAPATGFGIAGGNPAGSAAH